MATDTDKNEAARTPPTPGCGLKSGLKNDIVHEKITQDNAMNTDSLDNLTRKLAEFARLRDWDQFHSPKNLSMALIAEAAELVEHFQWLTEESSKNLAPDKKHEVSLELADILIFLIRIADKLDIDLIQAAEEKISINETRYPVELVRGQAKRAEEYTK